MKKKKSPKSKTQKILINKKENTVMVSALIIAGFALVLSLFAYWQTSGWTYREYNDLCISNGENPTCMIFYWKQFKYYESVWLLSTYTTVVSLGVAIWAKVKRV